MEQLRSQIAHSFPDTFFLQPQHHIFLPSPSPSFSTKHLIMESTCPIKILFAQSRRRARLDVPLRMEQLRSQIAHSFPEVVSSTATIEYVDEEGDEIIIAMMMSFKRLVECTMP